MTTTAPHTVTLDGKTLDLRKLEQVAWGRSAVELPADVRHRVLASRKIVDDVLASGRVVYGINTGFGRLSSIRIEPNQVRELQRNLVRSHSAGVGDPLPDHQVRALIALRINSLVQGRSGVRPELLEALVDLLRAEVYPLVPSRGSVGASGDLAPLAHVALGLMGEGEARVDGQVLPAREALAVRGLKPFAYEAKEALALINGTQLMTAVGGLSLARAERLLDCADAIAGMSIEALMGTDTVFDPELHAVRPHPGQQLSAANLRRCLKESELVASHKNCSKVQDPYSLRCVPQVHGAARDGWSWAAQVIEREINSVTDNPVVLPASGKILSGGNFHGAPVALALDCAAVALSYLGSISERRCDKLLSPDQDSHPDCPGLPPFLTRRQGRHSGMMLLQYVAAALASENKILTHPASADSIPTSAGHEDHVSMGPAAAYKLERLVDHTEQVLTCEWICAGQALEFRRPLTFGPGTEAALACLRTCVAPLEEDRPLYADLAQARQRLADGTLWEAVVRATGQLE